MKVKALCHLYSFKQTCFNTHENKKSSHEAFDTS